MIKKYVTRRQRAEERKNKIKKTVTLIVAILVVAISFCNSFAQSIEGSWATIKKGEVVGKVNIYSKF